jgi:hypothetical protein
MLNNSMKWLEETIKWDIYLIDYYKDIITCCNNISET